MPERHLVAHPDVFGGSGKYFAAHPDVLAPSRRVKKEVQVDYTCFSIPDEFVVGYGLDYDQKYRNLPYIGAVEV